MVKINIENFSLTDEDYANKAERRIEQSKNKNGWFRDLTTTKIRSIYALIMNVFTRITDEETFNNNKSELQYIKVRMAYESGREEVVRRFIEETGLMSLIDNISSYEQFNLYCKYAESLVAYFKFYGGKE